jgi:hypothetical protein
MPNPSLNFSRQVLIGNSPPLHMTFFFARNLSFSPWFTKKCYGNQTRLNNELNGIFFWKQDRDISACVKETSNNF